MKPLILVIDDDLRPTEYYINDLRKAGFDPVQSRRADEAFEYARSRQSEVKAVVLDIMMPTGDRYDPADTEDGLKTGVLLYKELRQIFKTLPFFILTCIDDQDTLAEFANDGNVWITPKVDYLPEDLTKLVISKTGISANRH